VPHSMQGQQLEDFPNLKKWYDELRARPATQRGFAVMAEVVEKMRAAAAANQPIHDQKAWDTLFGNKQFEKR
jgi:GST-like protein